MNIPQSESAESVSRPSKRKGPTSISTLTPEQLAHRRARGREAQRTFRARTKQHIQRLERELEELKGHHSCDKTVQDLLHRNKMLEDELARLHDNINKQLSKPTSLIVLDDNLSSDSNAMSSPLMLPIDYNNSSNMPEYSQHYFLLNESWLNISQ